MSKRLGRLAGIATVVVLCAAILLVVPILFLKTSPLLSAMFVAVLLGAFGAAWIAEFMYRKSFPDLFRKFEKQGRGKPPRRSGAE